MKTSVKQLHALIDELNDAGQAEMLTALQLIMTKVARDSADDGDLNLEDDDKPARKAKGKKGKAKATDDDDDLGDLDDSDPDADEGGEDDAEGDLGDLDDLDVDDEDAKPAKKSKRGAKEAPTKASKRRRGKAVEEPEEEEAEGLASIELGDDFDDFLDAVDEVEDIEVEGGAGVRELSKTLQDEFGLNPNELELDLDKKLKGRDLRVAKTQALGEWVARMEHIRDQLVEAGEERIEEIAEERELDLDGIKGRGKAKLAAMACAIIEDVYGPDED